MIMESMLYHAAQDGLNSFTKDDSAANRYSLCEATILYVGDSLHYLSEDYYGLEINDGAARWHKITLEKEKKSTFNGPHIFCFSLFCGV